MNTRSLQLQDQISDARAKLLAHPVYAQINDINGRFVKDIDVNNSNEVEINISNLSQGIYFIKIISEKESVTKKLIVE